MDAANAQQKNVDKSNNTGVNTPFGVAPGMATPSVAEKMKEKPTSRQKKFWMAWFSVIFLVIIGLIIAIVVVSNTRNSAGNSSDSDNMADNRTAREIMIADKFEKCMENETVGERFVCAREEYDEKDPSAMYGIIDMMIDYYKAQNTYMDVTFLITQRSVFMVAQGQCESAMGFYEAITPGEYQPLDLMMIYQGAVGVAQACFDVETEQKWQEQLDAIYAEVGDYVYVEAGDETDE